VLEDIKAKPEGNISTNSGIAVFNDGVVEIICSISSWDILGLERLPKITITNLSEETLIIDWNTASFVDPSGNTHRAVYEGIKYIKATEELPPVTLAPRSRFETLVFAGDLIRWNSILNTWDVNSPLKGYKNPSFTLVIPIKKGGETIYYTLDYQVIITEEATPPAKPKEKTIRVGIDNIPIGVYTSLGEDGEPDTLLGLALNILIPGIGFRKYFKINKEYFAYGELGTLLIIPYVGLGVVYANKNGLEFGLGLNIYPGADENGNFLLVPFPNFIIAIRF